jgi:cell volume regulation protein A
LILVLTGIVIAIVPTYAHEIKAQPTETPQITPDPTDGSQSSPVSGSASNSTGGQSELPGGIQISSPEVMLLALAIVIVAGVLGESFFRKTGIPDIAFLMIIGVLFGPVLNVISTDAVVQIVPYFAALALIMIMFDGGLGLRITDMVSITHFAFPLAVIGFVASTLIVSLIAWIALGWGVLPSVLLGVMVGGSSSIVVFGLVRRLNLSEETKALLSLESALTDILATIAAFVLFGIIVTSHIDVLQIAGVSLTSIVVGIGLGIGAGIPWIYVASKLSKTPHAHMFTLAALFMLFFVAKSLGESGALTALVFGLVLGNKRLITKYLKLDVEHVSADNTFHNEVTFLVRTFFFVFIGLLANLGRIEYIIFGVIMAVAIYVARIQLTKYVLRLSTGLSKLSFLRIPATAWKENNRRMPTFDRKIVEVMMPRGLAAAVLATIPLTLGLPNSEVYPQIVFVVIISSVVITTVGLARASKGQVVKTIPHTKEAKLDTEKKLDEPNPAPP